MPNPSLLKNYCNINYVLRKSMEPRYIPIDGEIMRFKRFPMEISPKVNVIAQLDFELANYDVAVQHVSHYTTKTLLFALSNIEKEKFGNYNPSDIQFHEVRSKLLYSTLFFPNVHLLPLFFGLFTQIHLLIDGSVEGQYITLYLPSYGLISITPILQRRWLRHWITHKSWYANKKKETESVFNALCLRCLKI